MMWIQPNPKLSVRGNAAALLALLAVGAGLLGPVLLTFGRLIYFDALLVDLVFSPLGSALLFVLAGCAAALVVLTVVGSQSLIRLWVLTSAGVADGVNR